jgi:hypothetical protein
VIPQKSVLIDANTEMDVVISPHSLISFDLALARIGYIADM